MVRYASPVGESGRGLSHTENISSMAVADGKPASCSCLLRLSSPVPMTTPLSLTFSLRCHPLDGYLPPRLCEPPIPRSGNVHFRLGTSYFSCLKTFQGD